MNCICGTPTRVSHTGIASGGDAFQYCPNCKEDLNYILANRDKFVKPSPYAQTLAAFVDKFKADANKAPVNVHIGPPSGPPISPFYVPRYSRPPISQWTGAEIQNALGSEYGIAIQSTVHNGVVYHPGDLIEIRDINLNPVSYDELEKQGFLPCDGDYYATTLYVPLFATIQYEFGVTSNLTLFRTPAIRSSMVVPLIRHTTNMPTALKHAMRTGYGLYIP